MGRERLSTSRPPLPQALGTTLGLGCEAAASVPSPWAVGPWAHSSGPFLPQLLSDIAPPPLPPQGAQGPMGPAGPAGARGMPVSI